MYQALTPKHYLVERFMLVQWLHFKLNETFVICNFCFGIHCNFNVYRNLVLVQKKKEKTKKKRKIQFEFRNSMEEYNL